MKNIDLSISYTTRNQRLNEINGKDYKFVTKKQFIELKNKNYFIETALNFGNYYGSPFKNFSSSERNKKDILFDIDWKGARKIRKKIEKNKILDFFILPPSIKELKNRLIKRGRDNKNDINLRLSYAIKEIKHYNEYSYVLINRNVIETVNDIIQIIKSDLIIEKNNKLTAKKIKSLINF
tara:strand:- start:82 stop:621 length:540 start_codon:yes stop_codon:yes gene_type:complete